jgi:DNA polymerase-3 subunit gamma/tau
MTQELYKKHRPRTLNKILGAEGTVAALENMLTKGTLPHTLLISGPSGCGKTTIARILKTRLNCHDMDFKEMNCSDHNGVDTVREIIRLSHLAPTGGDVRIWMLDECHKLTSAAQEAALKILEDTPSHVYFFLCTTDPQKLIKTILTRCCDMPVRLLTYKEISELVIRVSKREQVELDKETLEELVDSSEGSARTALVALDKILNLKPEERIEALHQVMAEEKEAFNLFWALMKKEDWRKITNILQNLKGEPESIRYSIIGMARAQLLKQKDMQAYNIICAFENNFYDSKNAGVIRACFESVYGG